MTIHQFCRHVCNCTPNTLPSNYLFDFFFFHLTLCRYFSLKRILFKWLMNCSVYSNEYIKFCLVNVFVGALLILSLVNICLLFNCHFIFRENYWDRKVHLKIAHMPPVCLLCVFTVHHTQNPNRVLCLWMLRHLFQCNYVFFAWTCFVWLQNAIEKWKITKQKHKKKKKHLLRRTMKDMCKLKNPPAFCYREIGHLTRTRASEHTHIRSFHTGCFCSFICFSHEMTNQIVTKQPNAKNSCKI